MVENRVLKNLTHTCHSVMRLSRWVIAPFCPAVVLSWAKNLLKVLRKPPDCGLSEAKSLLIASTAFVNIAPDFGMFLANAPSSVSKILIPPVGLLNQLIRGWMALPKAVKLVLAAPAIRGMYVCATERNFV